VLFHEAIARRLGLNAAEHKALGFIIRQGPMPAGALAPLLGVGPSAVTGIVDRLQRAGYVSRDVDPADRRRVLVSAVPEKVPDITAVFERLSRDMWAFMAGYGERERAVIQDYLTNTIRVVNNQTALLAADEARADG